MFQPILYGLVFLLSAATLRKVRSRRLRQALLLIANYALYFTWGFWFAAVLFTSTLMNFLVGEWLRRKSSLAALWSGIFLNLALLGLFKYLPEVAVGLPSSSLQSFSHLVLPLGISFWTFQAMSYLFDLYRGDELDPTFLEFALYMVFFPVAISGPICRMPDMLPQFRSEQPTPWSDIGRGLNRIATGVLMMQLARLLGQGILGGDGIHSGFDRLSQWSGPDVWCLAVGYGLQLFFDFAGYSHIAIGAAQAMGFTLPENFARPFESTSPSIFWTRWHMSLSFWIRDYVFLPLAMLRREVWWRNLALVISMILFGLWHRATLLFLLWGSYHGVVLVLHRQVQQLQRRFQWEPPVRFWTPLAWVTTMVLISAGWIFFRGNSPSQVRQMLSAILSANYASHYLSASLYLLVTSLAGGYGIVLVLANALNRYSAEREHRRTGHAAGAVALIARWRWYWIPPLYVLGLILLLAVTLTQNASTSQFMYMNF